jgi:hypothetical protein
MRISFDFNMEPPTSIETMWRDGYIVDVSTVVQQQINLLTAKNIINGLQ